MTKSLNDLKNLVAQFVREREWEQFHDPKNLSCAISIEAAELMEIFRWIHSDKSYEIVDEKNTEVRHEIADVFIATLAFCVSAKIDPEKAIFEKLEEIKKKYPVEKVKGKSKKYTEY